VDTRVIVFPFDLFGGAGAGAGASLVADELRTILADNRREKVPTRARAYAGKLRLVEHGFEQLGDYADWRRRGRDAFRRARARGERVVWLGGNHLSALPVYDELAGRDGVLVVQLDAHLDLHHYSDSVKTPTHANFLLHVEGRPPPLVNLGHRELLPTADDVARYYRRAVPAAALAADPGPALAELRRLAAAAVEVYLDLDWDVLDAAYFPAVAQPVPFGLSPAQVLAVIDAAWGGNVAGVLLSEFDPGRDAGDRSLAAVVWLLEHLLLRWYENA
jgi:arginase family enzyme